MKAKIGTSIIVGSILLTAINVYVYKGDDIINHINYKKNMKDYIERNEEYEDRYISKKHGNGTTVLSSSNIGEIGNIYIHVDNIGDMEIEYNIIGKTANIKRIDKCSHIDTKTNRVERVLD